MGAESESYRRYVLLFQVGMENAEKRLKQGGDAHAEQALMSFLGSQLKIARESQSLSVDEIASQIGVNANFILLGEYGALEPSRFFEVVDEWGTILRVNIPHNTKYFNESFRPLRKSRA